MTFEFPGLRLPMEGRMPMVAEACGRNRQVMESNLFMAVSYG